MSDPRPIGVFDSGVGGLTVYRALRARLPQEDFVYLGDTARLPYGTKSPDTVAHFAEQIAERLLQEQIKMLVVACNTASAHAIPRLRQRFPDLPVLGVIEPGAEAAVRAAPRGKMVVMATEGTVRSGAYQNAIRRRLPESEIEGLPCGLLVGLAEEGWCEGPEAEAVLRRYLGKIHLKDFDAVILGCTHFPLLAPTITRLLPPGVVLIDSAHTTAEAVAAQLEQRNLITPKQTSGTNLFFVTDGPERFRLLAERFLAAEIDEASILLVDLP